MRLLLGAAGKDGRQGLSLADIKTIRLTSKSLLFQFLGPCSHGILNLFKDTGKELGDGSLEYRLIGKSGLEPRFPDEQLVTRDLAAALRPQKVRDLLLGKSRLFPICQ